MGAQYTIKNIFATEAETNMSQAIRIVTDTTAALPAAYLAAHHIENIPQVVLFGQESFFEERNLAYAEFIARLKTARQLPKTAAPLPGHFLEAYQRQLAHAPTILSLHPSLDVSGTVRSATLAKAELPGADIRIVDTRTVGGNLAALVMAATEWAEQGVDADEIMRRLAALIPRGRTFFLVATLDYLQRGGRIGGASALLGTALQIKPILEIKNGRVEAFEKIRTYHHALERLKELTLEQCARSPAPRLSVMHADDLTTALRLQCDLQITLGIRDIPIYSVGASITTHAGPGTVGVGFFV